MDISCRPVMSSVLQLECPVCGQTEDDTFELIEDGRPCEKHCAGCGAIFHFVVMECPDCAAESLFSWTSHPTEEALASLKCSVCGQPLAEHETAEHSADVPL
jgi:transcription elongation factor Elf1